MKTPAGWVKLHRAALGSGLLKDGPAWQVFTWALLSAAFVPVRAPLPGGRSIGLKPGQVLFTYRTLADELGLTRSATARAIDRLSARGTLLIKGRLEGRRAGRGQSLLTIVNFSDYQSADGDPGTQAGTRGGTQAGRKRDASGTQDSGNPRPALDSGPCKNSRTQELKKEEREEAAPEREPSGPDVPRSALSRAGALPEAEAEADPEPERLARLFARLRQKATPDAVIPENLAGWISTFAAMLAAGTRSRDLERAMRFGFEVDPWWVSNLTDPASLRKHLARLLEQSAAREGKRAAADADREQAARARRAQARPPVAEEPEAPPTEAVARAGLQAIGEILGGMGFAPPPEQGEQA